jgi:hypothetical protein
MPKAMFERLARISREILDDGRFPIIYRGDFREDSFADAVADWLKKHGDPRRA